MFDKKCLAIVIIHLYYSDIVGPQAYLKNYLTKKDSKLWIDKLNINQASNNRYCHLCCINTDSEIISKHCGFHTLCKYPTNETGPACKGYIPIEFSNLEKEAILDVHNTMRNLVASGNEMRGNSGPQPTAANMRSIEWNNELAFIAKRWAAQCVYGNDVCRDLERFPVGQNIAQGNFATNNELSFIIHWYNQVENFNKSFLTNYKSHQNIFDSYTQLIWADTYQIGCARAVFQVWKGPSVMYKEHFICNYGPTGNIPNQPVYQIGKPCSACHEGTRCLIEYPSLCGGEMISNMDIIEKKQGRISSERNITTTQILQMNSVDKSKALFTTFLYLKAFYVIVVNV